ncbi:Hypothetical protein ETEE_1789 [Edwardsiella anguillarum ET080813]|uniref:Uncharacterized protein n=1 Tax=Edwardsiella anguillarum ET080813 TaxID=667120 RepID=A0A076LJV0_9GAMM|nr:Hypothetical protein ETEE_1789 [Edwardsiella anguillarum ET080813]
MNRTPNSNNQIVHTPRGYKPSRFGAAAAAPFFILLFLTFTE